MGAEDFRLLIQLCNIQKEGLLVNLNAKENPQDEEGKQIQLILLRIHETEQKLQIALDSLLQHEAGQKRFMTPNE